MDADQQQMAGGNQGEDDDEEFRTLVAICYKEKVLGLSCFDELSNTIMTDAIPVQLEDIEDLLVTLKNLINPSLFIVNPHFVSNKGLLDLLLMGVDGEKDTYRNTVSKSANWNPVAALDMMCNKLTIKAADDFHSTDDVGNKQRRTYLQLASSIDLDSEPVKMSMGALLHYLSAHLFNMDDGNVVVSGVRRLPNLSLCRIDTGDAARTSTSIFSCSIFPLILVHSHSFRPLFPIHTTVYLPTMISYPKRS